MSVTYRSNRREVLREVERRTNVMLTKIGLFVEGESKVRSPVDTGNLKGSIDSEVARNNKSVQIGTNVEYALDVEKGTRKQRPQPYLTPALEDNIDNIGRLAEETMRGFGND